MIRYLTIEEVIALNQFLIQKYSPMEQHGVRDIALLESAVNRPQQSAIGKDAYPDIPHKAAALFESLAQNHAFYNANKRVAFAAMVQFLRYNKYRLMMDPKAAEEFTIGVVTHAYSFEEIAKKIQQHMVKEE